MWKRKELKNKAKQVIKNNYWTVIVVCFILALFTSDFAISTVGLWEKNDSIDPNYALRQEAEAKNEEAMKEIEEKDSKIREKIELLTVPQLKILEKVEDIANNAIRPQKYLVKIWDAIQFNSYKETGIAVTLAIASVLGFVFVILISNTLTVAGKNYFIKARQKPGTKINVLGETFKKGNWINVTIVMFFRGLYNILWWFTIIGGFIKTYEYSMIPYILAENPTMKKKEVFKLSKELMRKNKWKTFVLDLSFILWDLLSIFTLGLLNIFYVNPYKAATKAELYNTLKENNQKND